MDGRDGRDDEDGYAGPATLTVGAARFDIDVQVRGLFQPIDGRYHWYGRIAAHRGLTDALGAGRTAAVLRTPEGSAPCELSDPDPWHRFRVAGTSTPPYAVATDVPPDPGEASTVEASTVEASTVEASTVEASTVEASTVEASTVEASTVEAGTVETRAGESGTGFLPGRVRVAIIGAGFGGLGAGIRLRRAGLTDFVILERADSVGGTWRDNTYPGCACDVPSHLYSFSFAPNPAWSRSFSPQPEIRQYLDDITERYSLREHVSFGTEMIQARWDAGAACWRLRTSRGDLTADVLISAAGPLSEPSLPDIAGLETFTGEIFHSARWNHDCDLTGKRVAVVGTGASAIQIVPAIQPRAGHLTLFQRTPAWVMPRHDHRISSAEKWLYRHIPLTQRLARTSLHLSREALVGGFVRKPGRLRAAQRIALRHLARAVPDPALRAALTPDYVMGCKRILLSGDFYPALTQPNTDLVASGLAKVDGGRLIAQDGTAREADVLIFATGFHTTDMPVAAAIHGAGAVTLAQAWGDDMGALRGTTVAGFPNLCLVIGPNTGLGHNSMIHIIEAQLDYIVDYLAALDRLGAAALDARPGAQQRWCDDIGRRMARTVWATGGCVSWYLDSAGRNPTLWPGSIRQFRRATSRVDLSEYEAIPAGAGS
jgi:cation diffusion facilitator CzcD-associated flavoprotein CzcO